MVVVLLVMEVMLVHAAACGGPCGGRSQGHEHGFEC